jgi:hypothetical protein
MITLTRREARRMAGLGAAALAAAPVTAFAGTTRFPKGAVIRTWFKDCAPEALGGSATLTEERASVTGIAPW